MSRNIFFDETGGPEVLRFQDIDTPEPGAGEVRLRIRSIGVNRAEVMFRAGQYLHQPHFPATLGYEAAGEIEALGPDVSDFAIGDRVSVVPAFDIDKYGLYGEVSLAPARALVRVPKGQSWEAAAASWMQYGTAWGGLVRVAGVERGDVVLIPAASSSVGLAAIHVARMVGAVPVGLTRRSEKAAVLLEAGAELVIATEEQDIASEVMKFTGGKGAQIAFDPVGGPNFPKLVASTAVGGTVVVYGALSEQPTPLPMLDLLVRDVTIKSYAFAASMQSSEEMRDMTRFVSEGLKTGALNPKIAKVFEFSEVVQAHRFLEANGHIGKVVVRV
jgi:NADPH:quinone reductase-like Zn-dependent oxidoreductase